MKTNTIKLAFKCIKWKGTVIALFSFITSKTSKLKNCVFLNLKRAEETPRNRRGLEAHVVEPYM
jgi:hypothetical protein